MVSAFAFGGAPYQAVYRALSHTDIWVSPELLSEYRQVPVELEGSGKITREQTKALVAGIAAFVSEANLCRPQKRLMISRDPEDNMVLLITGDRDLLEIPRSALRAAGLQRLQILQPRRYASESKTRQR